MTRIFIPQDVAALAVGANKVAAKIAAEARARGLPIEIIRTGSRGMLFLEPLIEVETARGADRLWPGCGRRCRVPVRRGSCDRRRACLADRQARRSSVSRAARRGSPSPAAALSIRSRSPIMPRMTAGAGSNGPSRSVPQAIVAEVTKSGLRGRGGAGFPTGIKWKTVADTPADRKYVVCNFDEGDSGTFADRMIVEGDPFALIEGMTICGIGVGATKGYVYCRSEYPHAGEDFFGGLADRAGGRLSRPQYPWLRSCLRA